MIVTVKPKLEPVTLATVKEQLGIMKTNDTTLDAILKNRILVAREYTEQYTGRALITQTREKRWDQFENKFKLPSAQTVASVKYIDTAGVEQTLAVDQYELMTYGLVPHVRPAYGVTYPSTRQEEQAVRIVYTAGYGLKALDVPELIRAAIIEIVGHLTNNQAQTEDGILLTRIPMSVRDKLNLYKVEWL